MSRPIGKDPALLEAVEGTVRALETEAETTRFSAPVIARLPRFLRSFYLRFLDEALDQQIERFTREERDRISDLLVDLEEAGQAPATWPLLFDFVDLCDYFEDFGLLSVPEAAEEHEREIFELAARILYDIGAWADEEEHVELARSARDLAERIEALEPTAESR
jgi:hypothetical protein